MEGILKEIYEACHDWMGFDLTEEQCQDILDNVKDIEEGIDTLCREDISYYLAKKIAGTDWPMNGDDNDVKDDFWIKLKIGANKHGYKLLI